jgi:hypothetical protein
MWNVNEATDEQRKVMLDALAAEQKAYADAGEDERAAAVQQSIDLWSAKPKRGKGKAKAEDSADTGGDEPDESWKRGALDDAARDVGVEEPEKLANKGEVVAAIAEAKAAAE